MAAEGTLAGVDELLTICHEDVETRTYVGTGPGPFGAGQHELLRGQYAICELSTDGRSERLHAAAAREVVQATTIWFCQMRLDRREAPARVVRRNEDQSKYHFRDGLVDGVHRQLCAG